MLEQILVQELKDKYLMVSPPKVLKHSYDVMLIFWIFLHELSENLRLSFSKLMIDFGVSINFQRDVLLFFVIVGANDLGKAAFS